MTISEIGRRRESVDSSATSTRSAAAHGLPRPAQPVGTIRAASADLRSDIVNDPVARNQLLDLVVEEADRLDRIIRNLLSLGRVEAGVLAPDQADESLAEIAKASAARLHRVAARRRDRARDRDRHPRRSARVYIDRVQIDQVLTNLIENAVRHAVGSSTILVTPGDWPERGADVVTSRSARRPGFTTTARTQAFGFFEPSGVTGAEGIGLAVCKAMSRRTAGTTRWMTGRVGPARVHDPDGQMSRCWRW